MIIYRNRTLKIGRLQIRWAYIPVYGWLPWFHTKKDRYNCEWIVKWNRLWIWWT